MKLLIFCLFWKAIWCNTEVKNWFIVIKKLIYKRVFIDEKCLLQITLKRVTIFTANFRELMVICNLQWFKGCVSCIFASLFCMFKREHSWKKKIFYFISKALHYWDNQILNFQIFKCQGIVKGLNMKHKHILLNNLESKDSLVIKFGQFMQH